MQITGTTVKYAFVLLSVGGAATGLNLAVMELADQSKSSQEVASTAEPAVDTEQATREPVQIVVDVPVVVPDSVAAAALDAAAVDESSSPSGAAVPAAPSPVAAAPGTAAPGTAAPAKAVAAAPATNAPATNAPGTTAAAASNSKSTTTAAPPTTTAPQTSQSTTTTRAPSTTQTAPTTEYLYYEFAGVASQIVVAQHGDGSLEFWSVTTESDWSYYVEENSPDKIKIKFEGDDDEAEWKLEYDDGDLRVKKER